MTVLTYGMMHVMTNTTVQVRATEEEKAAWKEAAWLRKVSLSEWMRAVLNATADHVKAQSDV